LQECPQPGADASPLGLNISLSIIRETSVDGARRGRAKASLSSEDAWSIRRLCQAGVSLSESPSTRIRRSNHATAGCQICGGQMIRVMGGIRADRPLCFSATVVRFDQLTSAVFLLKCRA